MKFLLHIILILQFFTACKKQNSSLQNNSNISIIGTWVLYQYQVQNSNTLISKLDTLVFSANNNYTYNNIGVKYYLSNHNTLNNYQLILYGTSFGNIAGLIPDNFETTEQINGVLFSPYAAKNASQNKYLLWLRKI